MPSLVCSSRYTVDSQILRRTAQSLGWETLRLDGNSIPDWFDPPDDQIALFYTPPHAFDIAGQLGRQLVGCHPEWTCNLPGELLLRELRQTTLQTALVQVRGEFVKHSVSKAFPPGVYDANALADATAAISREALVHIGEVVEWTHEFRCFVADQSVQAVSPYVYDGEIVADYDSFPDLPGKELDQARAFAHQVINHPNVKTPRAFVLDVGRIANRGWAVVECNECWCSGIYACDPESVLQTLLRGSTPNKTIDRAWDFRRHYFEACAMKAD